MPSVVGLNDQPPDIVVIDGTHMALLQVVELLSCPDVAVDGDGHPTLLLMACPTGIVTTMVGFDTVTRHCCRSRAHQALIPS